MRFGCARSSGFSTTWTQHGLPAFTYTQGSADGTIAAKIRGRLRQRERSLRSSRSRRSYDSCRIDENWHEYGF